MMLSGGFYFVFVRFCIGVQKSPLKGSFFLPLKGLFFIASTSLVQTSHVGYIFFVIHAGDVKSVDCQKIVLVT